MGTYKIDTTTTPGVVRLVFAGAFSDDEVRTFVAAHNAAIESLGKKPYRVFVDLRQMLPLSPSAAEIMEQSKRFSASKANFRGSAVCVASSLIALQHRRTSAEAGVADTEFSSTSEDECWEWLRKVERRPR
jgi:hypothetical protein